MMDVLIAYTHFEFARWDQSVSPQTLLLLNGRFVVYDYTLYNFYVYNEVSRRRKASRLKFLH